MSAESASAGGGGSAAGGSAAGGGGSKEEPTEYVFLRVVVYYGENADEYTSGSYVDRFLLPLSVFLEFFRTAGLGLAEQQWVSLTRTAFSADVQRNECLTGKTVFDLYLPSTNEVDAKREQVVQDLLQYCLDARDVVLPFVVSHAAWMGLIVKTSIKDYSLNSLSRGTYRFRCPVLCTVGGEESGEEDEDEDEESGEEEEEAEAGGQVEPEIDCELASSGESDVSEYQPSEGEDSEDDYAEAGGPPVKRSRRRRV